MIESKSYTDSAMTDTFKKFFNSFKVHNLYKYVELIDGIVANPDPIEINYNDFTDEIQKIFSIYHEFTVHKNLYRAIKEVLQIRIGSAVNGLEHENRIRFKILNYERFSGIFDKPQEHDESPRISLDPEDEISAPIKVFNVGKSLILDQVKSENDTEQIVIKVKHNGKPLWIDIFSPTFEQLVRIKTQNIYEEIFADATYRTGIKNLHAYALLNGSTIKPVFSRCALIENILYYDLQNQNGDIYKVSKDEIQKVIENKETPIFLKSPNAKTMKSVQQEPVFDKKDALDELVKLFRIQESDKIVFIPHLISFFLKGFPIPMKIFTGEQGSGKTMVSGGIKSLVDPEGENALSLPKDIDDLAVMVSKREVPHFDNTDYFTVEIAQFLCRVVTGTQYGKRKQYTNADEFALTLMSKIILNGIDPSINQPDLLERSIFYELPKISVTERMTDKKFAEKLNELRPAVLGVIFETLQKAMRIIDEVERELDGVALPRMATFAIWGEAISRVLGNKENAFIERYREKSEDVNLSLNEEFPLIPKILEMMKHCNVLDENKKPKPMAKTVSLDTMFRELIGFDNKEKGLPNDLKRLGKQIKKITPILRTMGYETTITKYNKRDGKHPRGSTIVTFTPVLTNGLDVF